MVPSLLIARKGNHLNTQEKPALAASNSESAQLSEAAVYKGLRLYLVTLLALTAVAWSIVGVRGLILHESYPRNSLLNPPSARFGDFTDLSDRVAHFGESDMLSRTDFKSPYPYPVPSIYAFLFFIRLFPNPLEAYLGFAVVSFLVATCLLSFKVYRINPAKLVQVSIWATLVLGFPLLFLLDRANIEAVVWVLILLGIAAYARNRMLAAAILWSLAASMKIFPGLLFVLFLAKRKYGAFAIAIAATVTISVLALAGVGPTIRQAAADSSSASASFLRNNYIVRRMFLQFDHSLLAAIKQVLYGLEHRNLSQFNQLILKVLPLYSILIPLGALLLYWFRLRRMPVLNQFMAYLILCVLLPYVSNEYTLVYVYLVWGAFLWFLLADVATGRVAIPSRQIQQIMFSCAVIFAPLTYLAFGRSLGFAAQVKTVFLVIILVAVLRTPMPSSLFGDLQASGELPGRVPQP